MGSFALRPSDLLTIHKMALSIGFRIFSFLPSCYSSYGALTFTPVGLPPTVHASLRWTHALSSPTTCRFPGAPSPRPYRSRESDGNRLSACNFNQMHVQRTSHLLSALFTAKI